MRVPTSTDRQVATDNSQTRIPGLVIVYALCRALRVRRPMCSLAAKADGRRVDVDADFDLTKAGTYLGNGSLKQVLARKRRKRFVVRLLSRSFALLLQHQQTFHRFPGWRSSEVDIFRTRGSGREVKAFAVRLETNLATVEITSGQKDLGR